MPLLQPLPEPVTFEEVRPSSTQPYAAGKGRPTSSTLPAGTWPLLWMLPASVAGPPRNRA